MPIAAFDTLKYARTLRDAGLPGEQAEAQEAALADALASTLQANLQDLVKKSDLEQFQAQVNSRFAAADVKMAELSAAIKQVDTSLNSSIKQVQTSLLGENLLLKWMVSATFAIGVAVFVRLFFFFR